jgi:GrpB-like predicted nucleotidyltransferase (UPF0157 family)
VPEAHLTDRHVPLTDEQIRAAQVGEVKPLNGRILLVDYDPQWAEQFEREAARIRAVLAGALRIEHVGSTSDLAQKEWTFVDHYADAKSAVIGDIMTRARRQPYPISAP